ncbi:MAG: hypothetical protein M1540_01190 [Candidatus Bathyarchaeota archaeon]|nr:hypothetical protein [Candidatus Bathyarchaeota archaeon]
MKAREAKLFKLRIVAVTVGFMFLFLYPSAQAQNATPFTPNDKFIIPQLNGSLNFAFNGTYTSAALQNDTWFFTDLTLNRNNSSLRLGNLDISVKDSNITIFTFYSDRLSAQFNRFGSIRYFAEGAGTQTINLNINTTDQTHSSEWGVINPAGVFLAEGKDWQLLPDNTVIVYGRTGNVTVSHYGFGVDSGSTLPFYMQHSVALGLLAVLAVTVAAATIIRFNIRRNPLHGN